MTAKVFNIAKTNIEDDIFIISVSFFKWIIGF